MRVTAIGLTLLVCFLALPAQAVAREQAIPASVPDTGPDEDAAATAADQTGQGVDADRSDDNGHGDGITEDVDPERPASVEDDPAHDEVLVLRDRVETLSSELEALREQVESIASGLAQTRAGMHSHRLPEAIVYAGHTVPLDRWDVAERLEREFYLSLGSPAQVILWLKRSARYFPYIEAELKRAGLPDDLKYVAVVESALLPRALS